MARKRSNTLSPAAALTRLRQLVGPGGIVQAELTRGKLELSAVQRRDSYALESTGIFLQATLQAADGAAPFQPCAVPLRALSAALKGAKAVPPIQRRDSLITVGRTTICTMPDEAPIVLPVCLPDIDPAWGPVAGEIGALAPFVTKDDTRTGIHGVYLDFAGFLVATDGHRLGCTRVSVGGELPHNFGRAPADNHSGQGPLLPRKAAELLARLPASTGGAFDPDGHGLFRFIGEGWDLRAWGAAGQFPDWRQVVPKYGARDSMRLRLPASAMLEIGKLAGMTRKGGGAPLRLTFPHGFGSLDCVQWSTHGDGDAQSAGRLPLRAKYVSDKAPDRIGLNGRYFADAIGFLSGRSPVGSIGFRVEDALSPIVLGGARSNRAVVVMPMRVG